MADIPTAPKSDLEAHARLMFSVLETLLQSVAHMVEISPAAAGLRAGIARARDTMTRAEAVLVPPAPPDPLPAGAAGATGPMTISGEATVPAKIGN